MMPFLSIRQGEQEVDYDEPNLNPLVCNLCYMKFKSLSEIRASKTLA